MPPTCLVAVALCGDTDGDRSASLLADSPPACGHEAVVCVVDTAARVIRCFLLAEPPEIHHFKPSSSSSSLQTRDVVAQLANLLQQLHWWRDTESGCDQSYHSHLDYGDLDVMCLWSGAIGSRSETQMTRVLQTIEQYGRVRPQLETIEQRDEEPLPVEIQQQVELRVERMAKRPHVGQSWKAEFPLQYKWFLRGLHEMMTKWHLHDETKYDGAFELELHTERVHAYMRTRAHSVHLLLVAIRWKDEPSSPSRLRTAHFSERVDFQNDESLLLHESGEEAAGSALLSVSSQPNSSTATDWTWRCVSSLLRHFRSFEAQQMDKFVRLRRLKTTKLLNAPSFQDFEQLGCWLTELSVLLDGEDEETVKSLYSGDEKLVDDEFISPLSELWNAQLSGFCKILSDTIDPIAAPSTSGAESEVSEHKQRAAQLNELRGQLLQCESEIEHVKRQVASILRLPPERIKTVFEDDSLSSSLRGMRVLLRVSRQDGHRVHQHSGSLLAVQRTSKASGMLFSSEKLDQLSAAWKALKQSQNEAEEVLVQRLIDILQRSAGDAIAQLVHTVAELDALQSFASLSRKKGFVCPQISSPNDGDEWSLRIVSPFDPFQERESTRRGVNSDPVPPLEVKLSREDGKTFLLLGNSNKNSPEANNCTLYSIGLIVTLSQIGCFVPCQEAQLPVFDAIYLRTGAYDEQLFGHSTFMTEMVEMKKIFTFMMPASLVLIDDLCRGTSTVPHYLDDARFPCPNEKLLATGGDDDDRDREFVDLMAKCDFPTELMQLIEYELRSPSTSRP